MGKITQQIAQQIIDLYVSGKNTYELGEMFGLWNTQVGGIIRGRNWKGCQRPANIKEIIQSRKVASQKKPGWNDHIHDSYPSLTDFQKDILTGSLLGDGCLPKSIHNNRFTKNQCRKYHEYLLWHYERLKPYSGRFSEIYSDDELFCNEDGTLARRKTERRLIGYDYATSQHPVFTKLRQIWYPDGKKVVPENIELTPLAIAIWFCDDGSNSFDQRSAIFCTESFTFDEAKLLCDKLSTFDINPRIMTKMSKKTKKKQPLLKVSKDSYDSLIRLIKPHVIWNCMSHKIQWRQATPQHLQPQAKLTVADVLNIVKLYERFPPPMIAKQYGVHKNHILRIVRGDLWSHSTGIKREHDV